MPRLVISLFGPLRVTLDGDPVTGFESDKVRALLAYLAVEAQVPHRREKLAGLLWPDQPESVARANLRHVLASLRKALGDRAPAKDAAPSPPFLRVSRQTIQFNCASDAWVDVSAFTDLLQAKPPEHQEILHQLEEAVELARGAFLEGFSLPSCSAFEEWALVEGERLQRLAMEALERLSDWHEKQGNVERALEYAWRQVELEPWREEAHQQVMRLLALGGQRSAALAQYETCRGVLVEELGVEPGAETTQLYERIRDGELETSAVAPALNREREQAARLPGFLAEDANKAQPPVFVARERELAWLQGFLDLALAGQGRMVFVTGGPGRGKTALLDEFARRAMEAQPDLLVASGNCNAYSGIGDAYLPFRDVMGMLTGDVEAKWAAGAVSRDHALRLWRALPLAVQALVGHGPHVVPALVPGAALLSRAVTVAPAGAPWLQRLKERVERKPADSEGLEQSSLFQQVSNVLRNLAEVHPLLLVLDDLQWADSASVGLLFHLSRRLGGNRILIAGAYRPEELAPSGDGASSGEAARSKDHARSEERIRSPERGRPFDRERHPLEKVLAELKRRFGDVWLDLAEVREAEGRQFVDALLATQPNRLGEGFRRALFEYTAGHPLFTVELLRTMQERGDLVQDGVGYWQPGPALDWQTLPPRVEGVIAERVGRLERSLREFLSVASVEGEEFTAQVVARVQEVSERHALQRLFQELHKQHRLVREQPTLRMGGQQLSRYRFSHALFQQYLYHDLSNGERVLLHGQIAGVLEELYQGCPEEVAAIAPQLAHHYSEAGDVQCTLKYLTLAGDWAQASYANAEALDYYSRALELTPADDATARYALLLAREKIYGLQGAREAQVGDLAALEALAEVLDTAEESAGSRRAEAALRRAAYERRIGNPEAALMAAQAAVALAQTAHDRARQAEGHRAWGWTLRQQGEFDAARRQLEQALNLARESGARGVEADTLQSLGWVFWYQGIDYPAVNTTYYEQALDLYREIGNRRGEADVLYNLGVLCVGAGDLPAARSHYEQARGIYREIGHRSGEAAYLDAVTWVCWGEDDYAGAKASAERALAIYREVGSRPAQAEAQVKIGETRAAQGYYADGEACFGQALSIFRETGRRGPEGATLSNLGLIRFCQGDYAAARMFLERAGSLCRDYAAQWAETKRLAMLGLVLHAMGEGEAACDHAQQALENGPQRYHLGQGDSALVLGHALAGLGDRAGATAAYHQALDRYRQSGFLNPPMEALAGLARVALAGGEPLQAMTHVNEILVHLQAHSLDGTYEPFRIYWTCYRVLQAHHDARAAEVLRTACALLQERAAGIEDDGLRCSFLENVPAHQWLIQEGQRLRAGGPDPQQEANQSPQSPMQHPVRG